MDVLTLRPEGLYCAAGDFYIDPWRRVPRAVITHAHADHARAGMGCYYTQHDNAALIRIRLGEIEAHGFAYGETFTLGAASISLHPAGHVLGSAQVRVAVDGQVWVVSGDYKRAADPTCALFEPVACDVYISEATFALPCYRWSESESVCLDILKWWDDCVRQSIPAVLLCYSFGKAQRVLAELARLVDRRVFLHGAMQQLVEHYRRCGIAMLPTEAVSESAKSRDFSGELILCPPAAAGSPWMRRFKDASLGFASGWMQIRGNRRRASYDRGFALSDHADWPGLIRSINQTGARRVLLTHGNTDALCRYLREQGVDAHALQTELGGEN